MKLYEFIYIYIDPSRDLLVHCLLDNASGYIRYNIHTHIHLTLYIICNFTYSCTSSLMYVSGTGPASPSTTGPCFQTSASVSVRQSGQPRSESGCFFRSRNYRVDILEASVEQNAVIWVSRWQGFYLEKSSPCLDPLWLPSYLFLWRVLCGLVVRVTQMLLTIQRCRLGLRHASGAWCWTICEVNGDKFEFSQEADANRFSEMNTYTWPNRMTQKETRQYSLSRSV